MSQEERMTGFSKIDVPIIMDFVVNMVLSVAILVYYKNLFLETGPENFVEEMIYAGSGTLLIAFTASILIIVIEVIYGILRLRGRGPYETGNLRNWAMMWLVLKVMILFFGVIISLLGVDFDSFLRQ